MKTQFKHSEALSILSSCCGVTGETVLTDSAVVILFAGLLGAGTFPALVTTAVLPFCNGVLILPVACLSGRIGGRMLMRVCCLSAFGAYLLAAASPFFGTFALAVLMIALVLFSVSIPGFIAGWFPLLDTIVTPARRTGFLGRMRFCHQLTAVLFLLLVSCVTGRNPGAGTMQLVLFAAALVFFGREFFLECISRRDSERAPELPWRTGLATAVRNHDLTRFSIWQFGLNLGVFGIVPLSMLYLKNELHVDDNRVIAASAAALAGMLFGYLVTALFSAKVNARTALSVLSLLGIVAGVGLFCVDGHTPAGMAAVLALLALTNFSIAAASVFCSSVMMHLAAPGNKRIAMAYCGAFYYIGGGVARLLIPVLLGWGLSIGGTGGFRTLFLFCGLVSAAVFLTRKWGIPCETH